MRNRLTFANAIFCLLLVGKIGHVGTLGEFPKWKIIGVLVIDFLFDFWAVMEARYMLIWKLKFWLRTKSDNIIIKKHAENIKKTL